ncbi:MAG: c-type cytochrome, partial [Planctomycetales bacterium]|nr:c-type cytochrome [Planctomycetales bacterium]
FGNTNNNPMWQYVIEDHYLRRNPHVAVPDVRPDVPDVPGSARVYPASRTLERFNDLHTANRFTSACCAMIYRDTLFGTDFAGNSFVSEPVHNLVHREVMRQEGVRLRSRRAADEQTSEFLASTDNWSRPAMIDTGPDGALWVADMYRRVIEHTEWIPDAYEAEVDVREGAGMGRIYRVVPVGVEPRSVPNLAAMTTDELVGVLESPSGPQRDLAQQLLVERGDTRVVAKLRQAAEGSALPQARLQALYTLDGLGALMAADVARALNDEHPQLRRHGVRLAESFLSGDDAGRQTLLDRLMEMAAGAAPDSKDGTETVTSPAEAEPVVLLQLALTLGEVPDAPAGDALGELAVRTRDDELIQAAVMSSALPHLDEVTSAVVGAIDEFPSPERVLSPLIASAVGHENDAALAVILAKVGQRDNAAGYAPWKLATVATLLDRLDRSERSLGQFNAIAAGGIADLLEYGHHVAADPSQPVETREAALALVGAQPDRLDDDLETLSSLLEPASPSLLSLAAVRRLTSLDDARVPEVLLERWSAYTPQLRREVMARLMQRRSWLDVLLDAVAAEQINPHDVDAATRARLVSHRDDEIRERAQLLFAADLNSDRQQVIDTYRSQLPQEGSAERGRTVFERRCAVCHRWQDMGHEVGPDLAALSDHSAEAMLIAVLDPNRAVETRYVSYTAVTDDGRTLTGLLADETGGVITLLEQESKQQVVQRGQLEAFESSGKSLMPEGLDKDISPADLADVIAFLQSTSPSPKEVPGNRPAVVGHEHLRGELACLAENAEIYGKTLRIEEVNGALGWWNSDDDRAVWEMEVEHPGRYNVLVEFSCDDAAAGNRYTIDAAGQSISRVVDSTGDWNVYDRPFVGALDLPKGRVRLTVRPDGPIHDALMDLKSVTLRPEGA